MKAVFILSDAIRWDYVNYMPFLKEQCEKGFYCEKIIPGIGFCEISEYISGTSSIENGNLFQITFNGNYQKKEFQGLKILCNITNRIPKVRWKMASIIDSYLKKKALFSDNGILNVRYAIPIDMVGYFVPTESLYEYDDKRFFPQNNLLVRLAEAGYTYDIDDFVVHNKVKGTDEERLERLKKKIENVELKDFTLLYIGKGEIAHDTGTDAKDFHRTLTQYDAKLKEVYQKLVYAYKDDFIFIVLGDHGMVNVIKYINPRKIISKIKRDMNLAEGEEFVYFIDSTCLRFWFRNKSVIDKANTIITEYLGGNIDNTVEINKISKKYGDLIYMLKPGVMFFPDFFNLKKKKGMHGYQNTISDQWGLCVCMGRVDKQRIDYMHLHDVTDYIYRVFNIEC